MLQASTLPAVVGTAQGSKGGSLLVATAAAAGESSFTLALSMDVAGPMKYLVVYASMYARFADSYLVFDNVVSTHAGA